MAVTSFNPDKMYTYLRGFASGAGMKGNIAKFSQNEPLKEFLLETGGAC